MTKPKGTPGGNRSPVQNEALKAKRYKRLDENDQPLDHRVTGVKLYLLDAETIRSHLPNSQERAAWLRRVIHAAVEAELQAKVEAE